MNKKVELCITGVLLFITISLASVYGIWMTRTKNDDVDIIDNGCVKIIYSDEKTIEMLNPKSLKDEDGMVSNPNTITINNNCAASQVIELHLDILDKSTIQPEKIKVSVNGEISIEPTYVSNLKYTDKDNTRTYKIFKIVLDPHSNKRINLRFWLDENATITEDKNLFAAKYYVVSGNLVIKPTLQEKLSNITNLETINNIKYFKGNVDNNYINFANKKWRILSILEDNTIKLIYADDDLNSVFNSINKEDSVGLQNSTIQKYLNDWYKDNLDSYDQYISKYKYCADTTNTYTYRIEYGAYTRIFKEEEPTLVCEESDKPYGNTIESKIGLITLDEAYLAGGNTKDNNSDYFLYSGKEYYTMSPAFFSGNAWVGTVTSSGKIDASKVTIEHGIRPVIVLINNIPIDGEGTKDNPYIVYLDD